MDKEYEEIRFTIGGTINDAVNELLMYKEKNKLAVGNFNGVRLYSDTVTLDDAYKKITGKSKLEFDKYINTLSENPKEGR